jgi:hypothetical protein
MHKARKPNRNFDVSSDTRKHHGCKYNNFQVLVSITKPKISNKKTPRSRLFTKHFQNRKTQTRNEDIPNVNSPNFADVPTKTPHDLDIENFIATRRWKIADSAHQVRSLISIIHDGPEKITWIVVKFPCHGSLLLGSSRNKYILITSVRVCFTYLV